ncbi:MAG: SH3 domain-containing protein [Bacteroidia bacterium]
MKQATFILSLSLIMLCMTFPVFTKAQSDNTLSTSATNAVCIWPTAGLRDAPGKNAGYIEGIKYGQRVQVLGEMRYVPDEDRVYMQVMSPAGKTGWVHKYLFEDGADMVVVKQPASIFERPSEFGSLTTEKFEPGELVAMRSFKEGWIELVSIKRELKGWVQWDGTGEVVSIEKKDINLALQMINAEEQDSDYKEVASLKALRDEPGYASSPVRPAVERRISSIQNDINITNAERTAKTANTTRSAATTPPANGNSDSELQRLIDLNGPVPGTEATADPAGTLANLRTKDINSNPNYNEELVLDATSGREYIKVTERGKVYEVKTVENVASVYYAYHKSLPKGTHILLSVPGNPGFVELEITNRLGENREHIVALPREVIDAVWGVGANSKEIEATIVYFVKK